METRISRAVGDAAEATAEGGLVAEFEFVRTGGEDVEGGEEEEDE